MSVDELTGKLRRLFELRQDKVEKETAAEKAKEEYKEAEAELWEELKESPIVGALKIDLGSPYGVVSFQPNETYYGRVLNYDDAREYFKETAQEKEYFTPKVQQERINSLVRECLELKKPLPPGLDFYPRRFITISKQKKS